MGIASISPSCALIEYLLSLDGGKMAFQVLAGRNADR
jgi:hypothetical protein